MAARMTVVWNGQLSAAVRQIWYADFFGSLLHDVINAAKGYGRQILAIGIARPILNGAGHSHVALGFRKPRRNLCIIDGPVFAKPIEVRCLEIDVAEARRGATPKIGFSPCCLASLPVPVGPRGIGIGNVVFEEVSAFAVFGLFHRVRLLMSLAFKPQGIAVPAILQIVNL